MKSWVVVVPCVLSMATVCAAPVATAQVYQDPFCDLAECLETAAEFEDNTAVLSPPIVLEPLYACASVVRVTGFRPGATIRIDVGFVLVAETSTTHDQTEVTIDVTRPSRLTLPPGPPPRGLGRPLRVGDFVRATQVDGVATATSDFVAVRDHHVDYPNGIPEPEVFPLPMRGCGRAVGARNIVPGATVRFFRGLSPLASVQTPSSTARIRLRGGRRLGEGDLISSPQRRLSVRTQPCPPRSRCSDRRRTRSRRR